MQSVDTDAEAARLEVLWLQFMMLVTGRMAKDANAKGDQSAVEKLLKVWVDLTVALFEALIRQLTAWMGIKAFWPISQGNPVINSYWGYRSTDDKDIEKQKHHKGIDVRAQTPLPVMAIMSGVIDDIGFEKGLGYYIDIKHDNGMKSRYQHLTNESAKFKKGEKVKIGDPIALSGETEAKNSPHLHMNVYPSNGKLINPLKNYHDHDIRSTDGRTVPNPMYNGTKGNLGTQNQGFRHRSTLSAPRD